MLVVSLHSLLFLPCIIFFTAFSPKVPFLPPLEIFAPLSSPVLLPSSILANRIHVISPITDMATLNPSSLNSAERQIWNTNLIFKNVHSPSSTFWIYYSSISIPRSRITVSLWLVTQIVSSRLHSVPSQPRLWVMRLHSQQMQHCWLSSALSLWCNWYRVLRGKLGDSWLRLCLEVSLRSSVSLQYLPTFRVRIEADRPKVYSGRLMLHSNPWSRSG